MINMNQREFLAFYDFTDRTILVTGGAGVLGVEISRMLVECNANVVILSRNIERGEKSILEINKEIKSQGRAIYIHGDVLNIETLHQANETIRSQFGEVDILINAAGGNHPSAITSTDLSFFDLPLDSLRYISDLNLLGTILPCQVFGRGMAERGEGVILNVSSMSAYRPLTRIPAYSAAKAAVTNFTQWLAVHMAQNYSPRIRVNAIAPGFFITNQNRFLMTDKDTGNYTLRGKSVIAHTPMNRFGTPEDLLGATMWLISPAAAFVTGAVIPIDGGFSAFSGV
jgi:NAD(P)-dependent dehydrogenase (short-subunit alcohol dehydrogenase family)